MIKRKVCREFESFRFRVNRRDWTRFVEIVSLARKSVYVSTERPSKVSKYVERLDDPKLCRHMRIDFYINTNHSHTHTHTHAMYNEQTNVCLLILRFNGIVTMIVKIEETPFSWNEWSCTSRGSICSDSSVKLVSVDTPITVIRHVHPRRIYIDKWHAGNRKWRISEEKTILDLHSNDCYPTWSCIGLRYTDHHSRTFDSPLMHVQLFPLSLQTLASIPEQIQK